MTEEINYFEDDEVTEEQLEARAARRAQEAQRRQDSAVQRSQRAKRWAVDIDATLAKLVAMKRVSPTWANGRTPANLRHMVKAVCIAHSIEAIGMTGKPVDCNLQLRH